jgi:hypothetical protein
LQVNLAKAQRLVKLDALIVHERANHTGIRGLLSDLGQEVAQRERAIAYLSGVKTTSRRKLAALRKAKSRLHLGRN